MDENEPKLSQDAKDAIRGYLISLVALPGAVLAIVMFFLGFFIRDVAQGKAEVQANIRIQPAVENAIAASVSINQTRSEAEKMMLESRKHLDEIKELQEKLSLKDKVTQPGADVEKIVPAVVASLLGQETFKASLASVLAGKYVELEKYYYIQSRVSELNLDVQYASKAVGAPVVQAVPNPIQAWRVRGVPP